MKILEIGGARVPALGLGTWEVTGAECEGMVEEALEIGYRHVDTAQAYENEEEVGRAIDRSGIDRGELFLTSKLFLDRLAATEVPGACDDSLMRLRVEYLDLLLIHWPSETVPLEETLDAMLELKREGLVRHLGVSNFTPALMERAWRRTVVLCNQVEYHPYLDQSDVLEKARARNMLVTAYSPLARGRAKDDEALREIGEGHGKSAAQVALRWLVQQKNVAAIPRARSAEHLQENFEIFDFELSEGDLGLISSLNKDQRTGPNPDEFNWIP